MMPLHSRVIAGGSGNPCGWWGWTAGFHREGWRERGAEVTTRMLTEHQGNQPSVDVILTEAPLVLHAARVCASPARLLSQLGPRSS